MSDARLNPYDYDPFVPDVPPPGRAASDPALALHSPEARMWVALLRGVVVDLRSKRRRAAAERWLVSTRTDVGSFQWICEMLKIEPKRLRNRLLSARRPLLSAVPAIQPDES